MLTLDWAGLRLADDMTLNQASSLVGGLSSPSKMPCFSYSIPAKYCVTGSKLVKAKDSVCSECYALKGFYRMPNVKNCLENRYQSLSNPDWVNAMVLTISGMEGSGYFRWHDSGDLQSLNHLEMICEVAKRLPSIKFWLPTREYSICSEYKNKHGEFPSNLTVRLSALKINALPPTGIAKRLGVVSSGVTESGFSCPSSQQGNKCLSCRACWNKEVENVNYKLH